jgi:hypothetical protein
MQQRTGCLPGQSTASTTGAGRTMMRSAQQQVSVSLSGFQGATVKHFQRE